MTTTTQLSTFLSQVPSDIIGLFSARVDLDDPRGAAAPQRFLIQVWDSAGYPGATKMLDSDLPHARNDREARQVIRAWRRSKGRIG